MLGIPTPQQSQGTVLLNAVDGGSKYDRVNIVGLNDFHGQLDPTAATIDGRSVPVGGAAFLATMFDEEAERLPGQELILAGGDNVGASPPNSALLEDRPAIDVENAWGLDATSYGNHEFDYGLDRLLAHQARANFPFLATNIVDADTGQAPPWVTPSKVFTVNGVKVGVIGAELESTPELVKAGATEGLAFLDEGPRIAAESERLRKLGVKVQVVVIHEGTSRGLNKIGNAAGAEWEGPILGIADDLQGTTVDAMVVGHTHRVSNLMRGHILITEGVNAGASYSVLQLMVKGGDVAWAGGSTRVAKDIGLAPRADVQAIIQAANDETAPLRNLVIGTQSADIKRDPARLSESAMGNFVADVDAGQVRRHPRCRRRLHQLGRTPAGPADEPAVLGWRGRRRDHVGRGVRGAAVRQRHGDHHAHGSPAADGVPERLLTGVQLGGQHRSVPGGVGSAGDVHLHGTTANVTGMWKTPDGIGGPQIPIGPTDTVRIVTNDFMLTGGDGYTVFTQAADVVLPGELLLDVLIDHIKANSPVSAVVEGRLTTAP